MKINENEFLRKIRFIGGTISSVTSLVLIFTYLFGKLLKIDFNKVISFNLCISSLFQSLFFLIQVKKEQKNAEFLCKLQGTFVTGFFILSFLITTVISIVALKNFSTKNYFETITKKKKILSLSLIWGFWGVYSLLTFFIGWKNTTRDSTPSERAICWPRNPIFPFINLALFFILTIGNLACLSILMYKIKTALETVGSEEYTPNYFRKLVWFFIIQFVVYFPFLYDGIKRVLRFISGNNQLGENQFYYYLFRDLIQSLSGFFFCLTYCACYEARTALSFCFKKKIDDEDEEDKIVEANDLYSFDGDLLGMKD